MVPGWETSPVDRFLSTAGAKATAQPDGSLLVRFRAGGLREMCWHAFEWRGDLEILEPPELRDEFVKMLDAARETHRS